MNLPRWHWTEKGVGQYYMERWGNGQWVQWSDVEPLLDRIKTLEAAINHTLDEDSNPKTVAEFGGYTLDDETRKMLEAAVGGKP